MQLTAILGNCSKSSKAGLVTGITVRRDENKSRKLNVENKLRVGTSVHSGWPPVCLPFTPNPVGSMAETILHKSGSCESRWPHLGQHHDTAERLERWWQGLFPCSFCVLVGVGNNVVASSLNTSPPLAATQEGGSFPGGIG